MIDYDKVKKMVKEIIPEITEIRHSIHMQPEIACKEFETSKLVKEKLATLDLNILPPFLDTDVVAIMKGKNEGKNVALRADIDALPLLEKTDLPYASKIDNMMHACGHDGHTAMLIGVAKVLNQLKDTFDGSVRFVFQPGEEVAAAGKDLVDAGALLDPTPDAVFALHASMLHDVGEIAAKPGITSSATDFFTIKVIGKGAHGACPEFSIDPIVTGSRIVESLQSIVSRSFSPHNPLVLSICKFQSGNNGNIIPDSAELEGTVRSFSIDISNQVKEKLEQIVKGVCDSMGAKYEIEYRQAYIPMINDPETVKLGKKITEEIIESEWVDVKKASTGGEDFAYYMVDYPGAMFRLGIGKDSAPGHNPYYDFNDNALYYGILFLVSAALETLNK